MPRAKPLVQKKGRDGWPKYFLIMSQNNGHQRTCVNILPMHVVAFMLKEATEWRGKRKDGQKTEIIVGPFDTAEQINEIDPVIRSFRGVPRRIAGLAQYLYKNRGKFPRANVMTRMACIANLKDPVRRATLIELARGILRQREDVPKVTRKFFAQLEEKK